MKSVFRKKLLLIILFLHTRFHSSFIISHHLVLMVFFIKICTDVSWEIDASIFVMLLKVRKKIPPNIGKFLLK